MTDDKISVVVVGSINMDLVARCAALPVPGQTLHADSFEETYGGKGANQAVAAARAGGQVKMVGRVGDGAFAKSLVENLLGESVDCSGVLSTASTASGLAMIAVDNDGENQIIVVSGANGHVSAQDVQDAAQAIRRCDVLLLQLEVPLDAVAAALEIAHQCRCRVILDPAPVPTGGLPASLFAVDLLCPNETEAALLTGMPTATFEELQAVSNELHRRGAVSVAITLSARGTVVSTGSSVRLIESTLVSPFDTTGAGDAFAGAMAVRWAETNDLISAVHFANAAGAIAATRSGAQIGMPTRMEIDTFLDTSHTTP